MKRWILAFALVMAVLAPAPAASEQVPAAPAPHLGLQDLAGRLLKLGSAGLIPAPLVRELQGPLDRALEGLQSARPRQAIRSLAVFGNKVSAQVPSGIGEPLRAQAGSIRAQIASLSGRILTTSVVLCAPPDPAAFQEIHVGAGSGPATVADALRQASDRGLDAVEVRLDAGNYEEGLLVVDRHTRIDATGGTATIRGRLVNEGPYLLELRNVVIDQAEGTAILVDHPCAMTVLRRVEVRSAGGSGVRQRGGFLEADRLSADRSAASIISQLANRHAGRGIHLSDGVRACMTRVGLDQNGAGALLAEGESTRVFASLLSARGNHVSSVVRSELPPSDEVPPGVASLEVRDGALFLGDLVYIGGGEVSGLLVDGGGRAHLRYSLVERTERFERGFRVFGGRNLASLDGELVATASESRLSVVGISAQPATGGRASASLLRISDNEIGIGIVSGSSEETTCALLCIDGQLRRNDRNVSATFLPIPTDPMNPPPPCPPCASVDFAPLWCTDSRDSQDALRGGAPRRGTAPHPSRGRSPGDRIRE